MGRGNRLRELGADHSQVHRLSSGCDLRHSGDHPRRSCAGKHGRRHRAAAGRGHARPHDRSCREALMSEWWTYSLSDFLLFSPHTYYRLFELYNLAVWPWHVLAIVLGLAVLVLWLSGGAWQGRTVAVILAICWLFVAWAYLLARYDTINWAASYFAAGYAVEALLLVWTGLIRNLLSLRPGRDAASAAGLVMLALALFPC